MKNISIVALVLLFTMNFFSCTEEEQMMDAVHKTKHDTAKNTIANIR